MLDNEKIGFEKKCHTSETKLIVMACSYHVKVQQIIICDALESKNIDIHVKEPHEQVSELKAEKEMLEEHV